MLIPRYLYVVWESSCLRSFEIFSIFTPAWYSLILQERLSICCVTNPRCSLSLQIGPSSILWPCSEYGPAKGHSMQWHKMASSSGSFQQGLYICILSTIFLCSSIRLFRTLSVSYPKGAGRHFPSPLPLPLMLMKGIRDCNGYRMPLAYTLPPNGILFIVQDWWRGPPMVIVWLNPIWTKKWTKKQHVTLGWQ